MALTDYSIVGDTWGIVGPFLIRTDYMWGNIRGQSFMVTFIGIWTRMIVVKRVRLGDTWYVIVVNGGQQSHRICGIKMCAVVMRVGRDCANSIGSGAQKKR